MQLSTTTFHLRPRHEWLQGRPEAKSDEALMRENHQPTESKTEAERRNQNYIL